MRLFFILTSLLLLLALLGSIFFYPNFIRLISLTMLLIGTGMAIFFNFQKHWLAYQRAECTRKKMALNLALDLLGLLFTMGAAMTAGRMAGEYFGIRAGFWMGLLAGFASGFLGAWIVRSVWGRLVLSRV